MMQHNDESLCILQYYDLGVFGDFPGKKQQTRSSTHLYTYSSIKYNDMTLPGASPPA